jgi:hypothetical protein
MKKSLALIALVAWAANAQPVASPTKVSGHIAKIISRTDGRTQQTAFKIASVHEEYEVLKALGLTPKSQALVEKAKPYDVFTAVDPATSSERDVWFDISSFYPEF